jgi:WD40 repeat protein
VAGIWNQQILGLADLSSVCCTQVTFNPKDTNTFASASLDRTVKVWSIGQPTPNFTLEGHEKGVNAVDYFTGGERQSSLVLSLQNFKFSRSSSLCWWVLLSAMLLVRSLYVNAGHCTANWCSVPCIEGFKSIYCHYVTLDYSADM